MKIEFAKPTDCLEIEELWRTCFPQDGEEYRTFYFQNVFVPQQSLVLRTEDGKIASFLQMIPYRFSIQGSVLPACYLSGVSTLPSYRHQGYMIALVHQALQEMYRQNIALSMLIPAIPGLYDRFGYRYAFGLSKTTVRKTGHPLAETLPPDVQRFHEIYTRFFEHVPHLQRSEQQWENILLEHQKCEGGGIYSLDSAYAFVGVQQGVSTVKEFCFTDKKQAEQLESHLFSIYPELVWVSRGTEEPFAQVRIIHPEMVLPCLSQHSIFVSDDWIPENNRLFEGTLSGPVQERSIADCGEWLNAHVPYMNLMLN